MNDESRKLTVKQYIKTYKDIAKLTYKASPAAVVVKMCGSVVTALLPLVTTYYAALTTTALAEAYSGDPDAGDRAIMYVLITAALGITLTAWNSIEQYIDKLTKYKIEAAVNDRMYEHFLNLDFWRYDDKKTKDLYDKATNFAGYFPYLFDNLMGLTTQLITTVAAVTALFFVSWWIGIIILVAIIPSIIFQYRLNKKETAHWNSHVDTRRMQSQIEYKLFVPSKIAELRLYGAARHLLDLRMSLRDKDQKERIRFERQFIGKHLLGDAIETAAEVSALLYTTLQIIAHAQPIGQFLYVQQVVSRALGSTRSFVSGITYIGQEMANLYDYEEFMNLPSNTSGTKVLHDIPQEILIDKVSFHYPQNEIKVLTDVSMRIKRGQHVAIVGANGAGKTTLIKILTGLYRPTRGSVRLDNVDLKDYTIASWHRHLGVLQQDYLAYEFATAKDNVYYGDVSKPFSSNKFNAAIDRADARSFMQKLPNSFDSYVSTWMDNPNGTKGIDLSGGQWQRLALARNFYRQSPIIILDEPTSSIDALAESHIFKHLFSDTKRTIVTISHRLTTIEQADIIYVLKEGRLVEQGTHSELVQKKGTYYTMFESQIRH